MMDVKIIIHKYLDLVLIQKIQVFVNQHSIKEPYKNMVIIINIKEGNLVQLSKQDCNTISLNNSMVLNLV